MLTHSYTVNVVYSHDDTQKTLYRNSRLLPDKLKLSHKRLGGHVWGSTSSFDAVILILIWSLLNIVLSSFGEYSFEFVW